MPMKLLASAIGTICGRQKGLFRLVLPRSLPASFKVEVSRSIELAGGVAVPVGDGDGEYTPGEAISYRTPEDGTVEKAIVLVVTDGHAGELKSLETFRDLLSGGLPGGLGTGASAILHVEGLALEVGKLAIEASPGSADTNRLANALGAVLHYLAAAYREAGNDEKRWIDAFWQHADTLADKLPFALSNLPNGTPSFARDVVFAAAGLPRPSGPALFADKNSPAAYAKVAMKFWSSLEEIERSLVTIDRVDRNGDGTHPLFSIDWPSIASSRAILGHPLLAVAYHGLDEQGGTTWLHGWASTSEKAFFADRVSEAPGYQFFWIDNAGRTKTLENLEWQGLDHILPPGPAKVRHDGRIDLGRYKLRLEVNVDEASRDFPVDLDISPASACSANNVSVLAGDGYLDITFELSRRVAKKGGKWREKPFTLSIAPAKVLPGLDFMNALKLKVCAPHPSRATAIALEDRRGGAKPVTAFASDERYEVDGAMGTIRAGTDFEEVARLKLRDRSASTRLAVIGTAARPQWVGGSSLAQQSPEEANEQVRYFTLFPMPDHSVVDIEGYQIEVQVPEVEKGQVNPVFASILGEPVTPADDDLRDELLSDPRGVLEQWYQANYISNVPCEKLRNCFGSVVLEASKGGYTKFSWNEAIGTFSNTTSPVNLEFPVELSRTPAARAFWQAFEGLELGRFAGAQEISAWPSALDLRQMPPEKVETYLAAFSGLLDTIGETRVHTWLAYPFSALLYNQQRGEAEGVLVSPLHPLRLAWAWGVQHACDQISLSTVFGRVASSFLRFVDGELFPLTGPAPRGSERWVCTGLAPGPREFLIGWTLLAGSHLRENHVGKSLRLMGLELPFGTPSGLDQGGVSAALRDYMRIYPASPQLRIGLAAPRGGERYAETDEAIIAASGELLARHGDSLPGGVRIIDSSDRRGKPPSAVRVLQKILPEAERSSDQITHAPFEWTTDPVHGEASAVDLQFIEDTVVRVRAEEISDGRESIGTSMPLIPFNRYRSWRLDEMANGISSFSLAPNQGSCGELPSFAAALRKLESLQTSGHGVKMAAELMLGEGLLGKHARWTITGNRHLDPSVLSSQLREAPGDIALWEWRPAFLSREKQKGFAASIASTHPYTVLARPSNALTEEVTDIIKSCGMEASPEGIKDVIISLGMRGVGLSSLLTMGHTQALGAIGFYLAFKCLEMWERNAGSDEIRCVVPMDAVYPLVDVLGEGAKTTDDQRRADLLLLSARLIDDQHCTLALHPIEVKMRSGEKSSFPRRGATQLNDPMDQLASTQRVLEQARANHENAGRSLHLVNGALATLLEAALSLRPDREGDQSALETSLLGAVAAGNVRLETSSGTLLWFQINGVGAGGGTYELRPAAPGKPGQFFANPISLDAHGAQAEVGAAVAAIVEQSTTLPDPDTKEPGQNPNVNDSGHAEPQPVDDAVPPGKPAGSGMPATNSGRRGEQPAADKKELTTVEEVGEEDVRGEYPVPAGVEILVGHAPRGASMEPVYFKPSETALNQLNIGVVGDLGTGKTQFLKSLVYQLSRSAASNRGHTPKVFIFDYKRDYSEGEFPGALGAKILDPSKRPLPVNFFALGVDPEDRMAVQVERVRRAHFFCDLLRRISGIGMVQRNDLYSSIMEAYQSCAKGLAPSIDDVFDVYSTLGKNDSVVSVLTLLRDLMIFEPNPENTTTFVDLFDRSTVLNLAGLSGAGQDIVDIVATMFLDHLYTDYMKTLLKEPYVDGPDGVSRRKIDSFVLIDEAHHAMGRDFDVLMKLMLEGREFGMGVVLSSQFLSHFDAGKHDWGEALSTWVVHNVRNANAKNFEKIGFRHDIPRMVHSVASLKTHWAYYRCVNGYYEGVLMKGQPFYSLRKSQ